MLKRTKLCTSLMLAFGGGVMASSALAQQSLERVEITGSAIKRIDAETALPVTVINREEIFKSGASNVQELIDRLSVNNGGGRSLGESVGETSATGQTGASLRGLGRERTLVLLNGRRLANYPFSGLGTDLNAIPIAAIERVEILRDGASAIYGSDAIGGVLNFITRRDLTGGEIALGYEKPTQSAGQISSIAIAAGAGDLAKDKINVLGAFNFQHYQSIKAADRDFSKTGNRPDIGVVKTSGNTFPANAVEIGGKGLYVPGVAGYPTCRPPDSFNDGTTKNCRYDFTSKIDIVPASDRYSALGKATVQLDDVNQLFLEGLWSRNQILIGSSQTPSTTTGRPSYRYPGGGKYYPIAAVDAVDPGYRGDLRISWRIVDGGQRTDEVTNTQNRLVLGGNGSVLGWDWKAGVGQSQSAASDKYVSGYFSDTKLVAALKTGNINPFGANDAAGLALLNSTQITGDIRDSKTKDKFVDLTVTRDLFALPAGPLSIAIGVEGHRNNYLDGYSDLAASGDIVGGSGTAGKVEAGRSSESVFTEVNFPVIKGLEVQAAVRYDRYVATSGSSRDGSFSSPSVGSTSPKVGLRYQPFKEVLVRGSYGQGFRAAALDNLYAPSSFTNTGGSFTDPFYDTVKGCTANPNTDYCNTQLTVQNNSNPNLKPEKSKQFSLGIVFEPVQNLTTSVDYFNIKITDGIRALTGDDILRDFFAKKTGATTSSSPFANRLVVDPATGYLNYVRASLENVGQESIAGFDLSARYRWRSPYGTITPGWDATILTKSTSTNVITGDVIDDLGQYRLGGPVIRLKQTFTLDYEYAAWRANMRYYRQNGYTDYDTTSHVHSYDLFDLQAQYQASKNLRLTVGMRNVFDNKPPATVQEDYFQVGFDPTYTDVKGRSVYGRVNYTF